MRRKISQPRRATDLYIDNIGATNIEIHISCERDHRRVYLFSRQPHREHPSDIRITESLAAFVLLTRAQSVSKANVNFTARRPDAAIVMSFKSNVAHVIGSLSLKFAHLWGRSQILNVLKYCADVNTVYFVKRSKPIES